MEIEERAIAVLDSKTNVESSKDSKKPLSVESSQALTQISKDADQHQNWCIAIWVKDVAAEVLQAGADHRKPVKVTVWNDGDSVEMIADSLDRRLEMVFASKDNGHWIEVSEVTAGNVERYSPSKRPILLAGQLRWLLGIGQ